MKKLKIIKILEYYDVPQLFIAEDVLGVRYLCQLYKVEENGELKVIGVVVSKDRLDDFVKGYIDLLTMFTSPELEDPIFHVYVKDDGYMLKNMMAYLNPSCFLIKDISMMINIWNLIYKNNKYIVRVLQILEELNYGRSL